MMRSEVFGQKRGGVCVKSELYSNTTFNSHINPLKQSSYAPRFSPLPPN